MPDIYRCGEQDFGVVIILYKKVKVSNCTTALHHS